MTTSRNNSLRDALLHLAQFINRKTTWLNWIKVRLGLGNIAEKCLVKKLTPQEIESTRRSLCTNLIEQQVKELQRRNATKINFYILLVQSIGDIIANEPIARHLKTLSAASTIHWIVNKNFRAILEANPYLDEIIPVNSLAEGEDHCKLLCSTPGNIIVDCHFNGIVFDANRKPHKNFANPNVNVYTHYYFGPLLSTFSLAAGLPPLNIQPVFYLRNGIKRPDFCVSQYIVFHCRSNETARDWSNSKWNRLAESLTTKGWTIIEIGTKRIITENYNKRVIDYTGQKDLQELATIVRDASLFIGVDSAFGHVANCFKTPSIILLGKYKHFDTYLPYSGSFPDSDDFKILRAPFGHPASDIDFSDVATAVNDSLPATI